MSPHFFKKLAILSIVFRDFSVVAIAVTQGINYTSPVVSAKAWNGINASHAHTGADAIEKGGQEGTGRMVGFAQLLPPLYRNVRNGDAWVFDAGGSESGSGELGVRGLGCECFDPQSMFYSPFLKKGQSKIEY